MCHFHACLYVLFWCHNQTTASDNGTTAVDGSSSSGNTSDNNTSSNHSNSDDVTDWQAYKILNETTTCITIPLCQRLKTFTLKGDTVSP
jgi:hypothetical protein